MKVFLAGASGAVGRRLTPMLTAAGHEVTGTSTTPDGARRVGALGARGVVLDALDPEQVKDAVATARPEVVISMLTGLAGMDANPRRFDEQFTLTNRLRTAGTSHLLEAARSVGSGRVIVQSFTGWTNPRTSDEPATEDEGLDANPGRESARTLAAIAEQERMVTSAPGIDGLALRFGLLYGPGTGLEPGGDMAAAVASRKLPVVGAGTGRSSFVHVDDAARATALAVTRGAPGVYNIVDDEPVAVRDWIPELAAALGAKPPRHIPAWLARPLLGQTGMNLMVRNRGSSNAKAKSQLGWQPAYPDVHVGFRTGLT
jgi:nucleoside-diphosphate-sugar epimerase